MNLYKKNIEYQRPGLWSYWYLHQSLTLNIWTISLLINRILKWPVKYLVPLSKWIFVRLLDVNVTHFMEIYFFIFLHPDPNHNPFIKSLCYYLFPWRRGSPFPLMCVYRCDRHRYFHHGITCLERKTYI